MDTGFAIYTALCAVVGALGIYFAAKCHRH